VRRAVFALALLLGCGPSVSTASPTPTSTEAPTPSPTPSASPSPSPAALPAGWTSVSKTTANGPVTFGLPPTWRTLDLDQNTLASSYERLAASNPDFAKAISLEQMKNLSASGLFVYAFDFDPANMKSGFATNMNGLTQATKTTVSVDVLAQVTTAQIEVQLGAKTLSTGKLKMGGLDASRSAFEYTLARPDGGKVALALEQYYVIANGYPHVLSFTTARDLYDTYKTTFEQIATTYRVG
jgi:hypothetical protein